MARPRHLSAARVRATPQGGGRVAGPARRWLARPYRFVPYGGAHSRATAVRADSSLLDHTALARLARLLPGDRPPRPLSRGSSVRFLRWSGLRYEQGYVTGLLYGAKSSSIRLLAVRRHPGGSRE
jgi:hypothetical protein